MSILKYETYLGTIHESLFHIYVYIVIFPFTNLPIDPMDSLHSLLTLYIYALSLWPSLAVVQLPGCASLLQLFCTKFELRLYCFELYLTFEYTRTCFWPSLSIPVSGMPWGGALYQICPNRVPLWVTSYKFKYFYLLKHMFFAISSLIFSPPSIAHRYMSSQS